MVIANRVKTVLYKPCLYLLLLSTSVFGLEVTPKNPVPTYSLVRVALDQGERSWVLRQDFSAVDVAYTKEGFVFTGPPGRYVVLAMTQDGQSQAIVEIGGSGPLPPNPPTPVPPTPPGPDRFGMTAIADTAKLKILPEGRPFIRQIAGHFASVASVVMAGGIGTRQQAIAEVQRLNRQVLGDKLPTWHAWGMDVGNALDALRDQGKFPSVQDYAAALQEISNGLMIGVQQ